MNHISKLILAVLLWQAAGIVLAQVPAIEWQNTIGGSNSDDLYSVIQTLDGGYLLGGYSSSGISGDKTEAGPGGADYWVVKLNPSGDVEWQNTIGGSLDDYLRNVIQTTDGGYLLGGYSSSGISGDKTEASLGSNDYWVVKLDASGNIEWQNTIGGGSNDFLYSVIQTADNGYLLGGYSIGGIGGDKTEASLGGYDYWVIKLDASGSIEWQNTIGGSLDDYLRSVIQTIDGGYMLGGYSNSGITGDKTEVSLGSDDYWVVKLDGSGNIEWQNTIGGCGGDYLSSVIQTTDGGYFLGGRSGSGCISGDKTEPGRGCTDYWVIKLNGSGDIEWQSTIGGNSCDDLFSAIQTYDGGYLVGGASTSNISYDKTEASLGGNDYWIVKLDESGNIDWQNTIGGSSADALNIIIETTDGGYMLGGSSSSGVGGDKTEANMGSNDYWVIKLEGNFYCNVPSGLTVSDLTPTSAKLEWDDAGGAATGYKLLLRNITDGTSNGFSIDEGMTSKNIGPAYVIPGKDYAFRLRATCDDGSKTAWSAPYFFSSPLRMVGETANISTYPNPGNGRFTLQLSGWNSEQVQIDVFNLTGTLVHTAAEPIEDGSLTKSLLLQHLPDGNYLLRLTTGKAVFIQQLIIQH